MSRRPTVVSVSDAAVRRASVADPHFNTLQEEAKDANHSEAEMSLSQAMRLYRKGICWSLILSTAVVMEGYDQALISNLYAMTAFNDKFGTEIGADGQKTVPASWRSGLNNGVLIGEILGLMATGIVQDRYGYKKTIGGALACMIGFLFIVFFAQNIAMLLVGEVLCGLCWGVFQTITTAYASDVTPVKLRAYLTTYVNACWVFGQLIAAGVLRSLFSRTDEWAYRIPFALQWLWPLPILVACIMAPESPWWLVRHGRIEDAKQSLLRLTSRGVDVPFDADKAVAMMVHTDRLEREMADGTSYLDCFRGVNLRRTEIVCLTWLVQVFSGVYIVGYSTVFYEQAGLPAQAAFNLSIGQSAMGIVGTVISWFLLTWLGRRTIYFWGCASLCCIMLAIGVCGVLPGDSPSAHWAAGSLLLVFVFAYDMTVGPVCYSLVVELPSTRLKAKTVVLARNFYNVGGIVANILINYQLTPTAWNWGAASGFFWGATCFLCVVWIYFRLPEPKGRTYGELDVLFENGVSARKFASTDVNLTADTTGHGGAAGGDDIDSLKAAAAAASARHVNKLSTIESCDPERKLAGSEKHVEQSA